MEMIYNGFLLSQLINVLDVKRPPIGDRVLNSVSVNGRDGEIFTGSNFGTKTIEVVFYMKYEHIPEANDSSMYQKVVTSLAYYLANNKEPAPLIFSDQPNLYYMAIVESFDLERTLEIGEGSITFRCFDPFLYSINKYEFTSQNGLLTIVNDATASCYPVFETILNQPTKYLTFVGSNGVVQVGNTSEANTGDTAKNDMIHSDDCTSSARWYAGSSSLISSAMQIDSNVGITGTGKGLKLSTNPSGSADDKKYHGTFIMTNLDIQPMYWQAKLYFKMKSQPSFTVEGNAPEQKGIIHFGLYDKNNVLLTQFNMRDFYSTSEMNIPAWFDGKGKQLYWDEEIVTGKTNTTTDNVKSLSELPKNATVLSQSQFNIYKAVVKWNGTPIYKEKDTNSTVYYKTGTNTSFIIVSNDATWCRVYLDESKTTVGFILMKHINKVVDHTEYLVTYSTPAYEGTGKWDDFVGQVFLERRKHENGTGSIWRFILFKKAGNDSWNGEVTLRKTVEIYDPNNEHTAGKEIAKVGVFMGNYQDSAPPQMMTFDDLVVIELKDDADIKEEGGTGGFSYIGQTGDVIKVDCGEQMVYRNNEPIMEFVDVGSDFFSIDAFSSSQIRVLSDDSTVTTTATIQKRYL